MKLVTNHSLALRIIEVIGLDLKQIVTFYFPLFFAHLVIILLDLFYPLHPKSFTCVNLFPEMRKNNKAYGKRVKYIRRVKPCCIIGNRLYSLMNILILYRYMQEFPYTHVFHYVILYNLQAYYTFMMMCGDITFGIFG